MGVILLARHGQASFSAEDYDALSPLGFRQCAVLGETLARQYERIDAIVCGAMRRQRETAETIAEALGHALRVETDPAWDEYDHRELLAVFEPRYRDFQVLLAESAAAPDPKRAFRELWAKVMARWRDGGFDHEYRESWPAFRSRVNAALERAAQRARGDERVLICSSGGPISVVCSRLLAMPDERSMELSWRIVNASITRLIVRDEAVHVSTLNEHGHLESRDESLVTYR